MNIYSISLLLATILAINCTGHRSQLNEREKISKDFQAALEEKNFDNAYKAYYKLRAIKYDKGATKDLITARIPYLLFLNEYEVALKELLELNYWDLDKDSRYKDNFDYANDMLLKVFYNAIENLDFDFAQKTLRYYRSYYAEEKSINLTGNPNLVDGFDAYDYSKEIVSYNETLFKALYEQRSKVDSKKLVNFFMSWAKIPYKTSRKYYDDGVEYFNNGLDKEQIESMANKLK